jgi:hypothetical protein
MALTEQEKELVREMICNRFGQQNDEKGVPRMFRKPVTPATLKAFAEKTDEEVRAEITIFLGQKKRRLEAQLAKAEEQKVTIESELQKMEEEK